MNNHSTIKSTLILLIFILQVLIDCFYSVWIKSQPGMEYYAWFYILPLLFFFYFALAFIASIALYNRSKFGLMLAYCILMFGSTTSVISYYFIYRKQPIIEMLIIPLIILNLCVIFCMVYNRSCFPKK